jgi:hypothetical protein
MLAASLQEAPASDAAATDEQLTRDEVARQPATPSRKQWQSPLGRRLPQHRRMAPAGVTGSATEHRSICPVAINLGLTQFVVAP